MQLRSTVPAFTGYTASVLPKMWCKEKLQTSWGLNFLCDFQAEAF
jgi:hypothetical protein